MNLLWLALHLVWALAAIRLLGDRVVSSWRTLAIWLLVGIVIGPFTTLLPGLLLRPLGLERWQAQLCWSLLTLALLALPVALSAVRTGLVRSVAIADVVLIAFLLGLGSDLLGPALQAAKGGHAISGSFEWIPPLVVDYKGTRAGHSYWLAFPALALAASLRFLNADRAAWGLGGVALTLSALDLARVYGESPIVPYVDALTHRGQAIAWIVLVALVAAGWFERRWVIRQLSAVNHHAFSVAEEWQALVTALGDGLFATFGWLKTTFRQRRQWEIVGSEALRGRIGDQVARIGRALGSNPAVRFTGSLLPLAVSSAGRCDGAGLRRYRWPALVIVAACALMFVLPALPDRIHDAFWSLSLVHDRSAVTLGSTPFQLLLMAYVVGSYVTFPPYASCEPDADDRLRYLGQRWLLRVGLLSVGLQLAGPYIRDYYGVGYEFLGRTGAGDELHNQPATLMLLLATIGAACTRARATSWDTEHQSVRRPVLASNAMRAIAVVAAILLGWKYVS